jgi:hypothetical protein
MIYLALFAAAQFGLVVYLINEQKGQARLIAEVVRCSSPDLCEMTALVDRLCQRIQAPELATAQHHNLAEPMYAPQHVPIDDDAAYFESKEDMAQRLADMELHATR